MQPNTPKAYSYDQKRLLVPVAQAFLRPHTSIQIIVPSPHTPPFQNRHKFGRKSQTLLVRKNYYRVQQHLATTHTLARVNSNTSLDFDQNQVPNRKQQQISPLPPKTEMFSLLSPPKKVLFFSFSFLPEKVKRK